MNPYLLHQTQPPLPLMLSCPHSGRLLPDDFNFSCSRADILLANDPHVDELLAGAVAVGVTLLVATFPRAYIDINRAETDLDPALLAEPWPDLLQPSAATLRGLGLIRRLDRNSQPMYDAALPIAEVQRRIAHYYRPYHAALGHELAALRQSFGRVWLLDCHSMPSRAAQDPDIRYADFVLGDRDGHSCSPAYRRFVHHTLQAMGYQVAVNNPYKGVEIMRRYGQPDQGYEALQLEINRDLYWDEVLQRRHGGFAPLQRDLQKLISALAAYVLDQTALSSAAE
jgi:N-formylglutamate amidohydrolase